jgi:hypothetical protein
MRNLFFLSPALKPRDRDLATLAALHAVLVAWVAWYVADAGWASTPISASLTPLPSVVFVSAWVAGSLVLLVTAPVLGAGAVRGGWVGPDPTLALPVGLATRTLSAWSAAVGGLTLVGLAPLPIYIGLYELGGIELSDIAWPVLAETGIIVLAPLVGVGAVLARRAAALGRGRASE